MSDNNELLKGIPTPKSAEASVPSTDTGNVPKVEDDDTRTRKTVKLSAAGMMPNLNKLRQDDPAMVKPAPSAPPVVGAAPMGAPDSPTVRLRPVGGMAPAPGAPAAAPAPGTDTGNVPKQSPEDTRTRRTVRITAASVEDTVKLQRGAAPAAPSAPVAQSVAEAAAEAPKPKLSIPKPAAPAPAPAAPSAPSAPAVPEAAAEAGAPATGRVRREKAQLNLVKDTGPAKGPSRVEKDMAAISGHKSAAGGSDEPSPVYTVIAAITLLALIATVVFSSQYLNIWQPKWADGFTILPSASESK